MRSRHPDNIKLLDLSQKLIKDVNVRQIRLQKKEWVFLVKNLELRFPRDLFKRVLEKKRERKSDLAARTLINLR